MFLLECVSLCKVFFFDNQMNVVGFKGVKTKKSYQFFFSPRILKVTAIFESRFPKIC